MFRKAHHNTSGKIQMKVKRELILAALDEADIATSKKGKPLSNEALGKLFLDSMDDLLDEEGNTDNTVVASVSAALDEDEDLEIVVVGDDPTVPKKVPAKADKKADKKKAKAKPAKEEDEDEDEEEEEEKPAKKKGKSKPAKNEDDEEKPAKKKAEKKKKSSDRDRWNSNPESSAGRINAVFFGSKKPLTIQAVHEALNDEEVTRQRVRDHIRRLHTDGYLLKDEKDRYSKAPRKGDDE
jgi:outer membrane biosynthesis protein TonB